MYLPRPPHRRDPRRNRQSRQSGAIDQSGQAQGPCHCVHTAAMVAPSRRGRRVRTMVSSSGSSGRSPPTLPARIAAQRTECVCQARELRH